MRAPGHMEKVGVLGSVFTAACCLGISAVVSVATAIGLGLAPASRSQGGHVRDAGSIRSFWLVRGLALAGRGGEAEGLSQEILELGDQLGHCADEIDPFSGEQLGDFPQAFTQIGLTDTALRLRQRGVKDRAVRLRSRNG
ncbi:MAG: hypothetical protein HYZ28_05295 [Myxococcales bacterium]|nr:hypothetical protein [Myxococcales bacterium]